MRWQLHLFKSFISMTPSYCLLDGYDHTCPDDINQTRTKSLRHLSSTLPPPKPPLDSIERANVLPFYLMNQEESRSIGQDIHVYIHRKIDIEKLKDCFIHQSSFRKRKEKHLDKIKVCARTFMVIYAFVSKGMSTKDNSVPFSMLHWHLTDNGLE